MKSGNRVLQMKIFVLIIAGGEKILPCPEMATEGALWFSNLTIADPTLILPFAVGIFNLLNIEVSIFIRNRANYHT